MLQFSQKKPQDNLEVIPDCVRMCTVKHQINIFSFRDMHKILEIEGYKRAV